MKWTKTQPRCKRGWWDDGKGKRYFMRSGWEIDYANYLEFLKWHKEIIDWEYETETFWFNKIKRGVRSYKPDFKIKKNNGDTEFHEVKGWMDAKSKTKIKRMQIYYPNIVLIIIDAKRFKKIMENKKLFTSFQTIQLKLLSQ